MANMVNISPSTIYSATKGTTLFKMDLFKKDLLQHSRKQQLYAKLLEMEWKPEVKYFLEYSFHKSFKKNKDVKLKWFQMRIIHRIIATYIVLNKMGVTANTQCGFCNEEKDSTPDNMCI